MSSEEPVAAKDPIPALGEPRDTMTAMQLVLEISALAHDGLAKGLHEGAKVIEKHGVQLCVLAKDCNQPDYVKLVKALCGDHNVSLIIVPHPRHSVNGQSKARKVVGCSLVVVKDSREETERLHIVQEYVKSH